MKKVEVTLYNIDELSEDAKNKARDWYKEGNDYPFLEEEMENLIREELEKLGFDVDELQVAYSLSYCQGDGASFTAKMTKDGEYYEVNRDSSRYSHEMTISEVYHEDDLGNVIEEPKLLEQMREIARKAEKFGYDFIESEDSDENVDEALRANDYHFTEEGKFWY